ncbi:MAG: hypothetical protein LBS21_15485 [Clostridiales bacterium]|jgi:hypothetical protein|nr:hypothetical protein [Clostridiales bacterium]
MDVNERDFKIADYYKPALAEGTYTISGVQNVTSPETDTFKANKNFYVAVNTETIAHSDIFSVYPFPEQRGDFSGTLPFIVLNNEVYPWMRHWMDDINGRPVPWLALIVLSQDEGAAQGDIKYSQLLNLKEKGVYFPYVNNPASLSRDDDNVHIVTIPKAVYEKIIPAAEDLPWLTHAKFINLSAAEDSVAEQNGWYSTIIANRFVPSVKNRAVKSTVHLVSVDGYLNGNISAEYNYVRFVSLHHWSVYSEKTEEKSFVTLAQGLSRNCREVKDNSLKPHYLRTGEKTYSFYRSPLLPLESKRLENINGEEKFTADGRLIYDLENGIFDVSYSAAFNLGRLITLSRRGEAEKIVAWRKDEAASRHLNSIDSAIGLRLYNLEELCQNLTENKLL